MRRLTLVLPLLLFAAPLLAQLNPQQRAEAERKAEARSPWASTRLMHDLDERVLNGDQSAYKGLGGRDERRMTAERLRTQRFPWGADRIPVTPGMISDGYVLTSAELHDHWFAIGQRAGEPRELRRAPLSQVDVRADIPLALTLASPIGAPGRTLMIRTAVGAAGTQDGWSRMAEVAPNAAGVYRVEIPALHAGNYDLQIEVYDPAVPELPYSSSKSALIAWVP
jgi:hypothetical protein